MPNLTVNNGVVTYPLDSDFAKHYINLLSYFKYCMAKEVCDMRTRVSSRAQVSIPASISKEFNIRPNSQLEWIAEGGLITVVPITEDPVASFRGRGKGDFPASKLILERQKERREEDGRDRG